MHYAGSYSTMTMTPLMRTIVGMETAPTVDSCLSMCSSRSGLHLPQREREDPMKAIVQDEQGSAGVRGATGRTR
jgi:hypothetical protein